MATYSVSNFVNDPSPGDRLMFIYNSGDQLVMSVDPYSSTFFKKGVFVYILTDGRMNYDNVLDFSSEAESDAAVARLNDVKKIFIDATNNTLNTCGGVVSEEEFGTHTGDTTIHFNTLDGLSDVNTGGTIEGNYLTYSAGTWIGVEGSVDLTNYYTKNEVYNTGETYTQAEIDILIAGGVVNGGVFIYDVTASIGNVGDKTYIDGIIIDTCLSDTQLVTLDIVAVVGNTKYKPGVTVEWGNNSETITNFIEGSNTTSFQGKWRGSIDIDLSGETIVTVLHEDGASHTISILTDTPPVLQSVIFTGGYPGTQTELKASDTYDIIIESDIVFVEIEIDNYGAFNTQSLVVSSTTGYTITGIIADRGDVVQDLGTKVRVKKSTGSWSDWYLTEDDGSVDEVNLVKLNNLYPIVNIVSITYPTNQEALKDSETATVSNTVSNFDTIVYSSTLTQLSITSAATYETNKVVNRIDGDYNISSNNLRIIATRTANNAYTTTNGIVKIANVSATLTVTEPYSRLRSGGNDGTSVQSHIITITSSQNLIETPTLGIGGGGTWSGVGFVGSDTIWTRSILVGDDMSKGSYTWGSILGTNLSGIPTSVINGDTTYVFGGFVSRTITLAAYLNECGMNVEAVDYTKVALSWSVKSLPNKRSVGTIATPDANSWCLNTLPTNPTIIRVLDTAATSASSVPSTLTIEETV